MHVCVCGWYLDEYAETYAQLRTVAIRFPVFVVSNRESPFLREMGLPWAVRKNTGLEWGAYNYYLMNVWDGQDDVLFMHDDVDLGGPVDEILGQFSGCGVDQAYVFESKDDAAQQRIHGRMVYMSAAFLTQAKERGGFWYDDRNQGYVDESDFALRYKSGCHGYNAGILSFKKLAEDIGGDVNRTITCPTFRMAKRGAREPQVLFLGRWWPASFLEQANNAARKANVGCGDICRPGYTNVDLHNPKADVRATATDLPFEDGSYDLVETHHLIEHLEKWEAEVALDEWKRVMAPGGLLFLSCPDIAFVTAALWQAPEYATQWNSYMCVLYGKDEPGMRHKYGYCRESLQELLERKGFVNVVIKTAVGHRPTPSLVAFAHKPLLRREKQCTGKAPGPWLQAPASLSPRV